MAKLTLRQSKGSALTYSELDTNLVQASSIGRRNYIINGGFDMWRRQGATFQNLSTGVLTFCADRWMAYSNTGANAVVTRRLFLPGQTDVPGNPSYYLRYDKNSAGTAGQILQQRIESVHTLAGEQATVSFYLRCTTSATFSISLFQNFGEDGSPSSNVAITPQGITSTSDWAKYTMTFNIPSISGKSVGETHDGFLNLVFYETGTPSAFTTDIANVQLERGNTATDFEKLNRGEILDLCQRYFISSALGPFNETSDSQDFSGGFMAYRANGTSWPELPAPIAFPTGMRAKPAVTIRNNVSGEAGKLWDFVNVTSRFAGAKALTPYGFSPYFLVDQTGAVSGQFHYEADAEL